MKISELSKTAYFQLKQSQLQWLIFEYKVDGLQFTVYGDTSESLGAFKPTQGYKMFGAVFLCRKP